MRNLLWASAIMFVAFNVNGQELKEKKDTKNEIGIVITDLLNNAIQLKYERLLGAHISVNLGVGYKGKNGIIHLSGIDSDQIKTSDIAYDGLKIITEARYYLNNKGHSGMDGFYFGSYIKYSNFKSDLDGTYINSQDESFPVEFDADINVTSVGLMVGYKLPISNKLSIDFLIAGPGTGFYNFELTNKKDLPDEFYEDLNNALDKFSIFDFIDADFRFKSANSKTKFNRLSFRYGISMGYSF